MTKRLVVGMSLSVLTLFGVAPAASAATAADSAKVSVAKGKLAKPPAVIDWDAPASAPSDGYSTQRIDWD